MNDTHLKIKKMIHEKMKHLSFEERIEMATSMFDCARELVIQSLKNENPNISEEKIKEKLLWRFYKFNPTKV